MQYFHTLSPVVTMKIELRSPKMDMSDILSMVHDLNLKVIDKIHWKYCENKVQYAIFLHITSPAVTYKIEPRSLNFDMSDSFCPWSSIF